MDVIWLAERDLVITGADTVPRSMHLPAQAVSFGIRLRLGAAGAVLVCSRSLLVLSVGADVRLALCFALEPLDWAIRKEFSDLCLGRSTYTLAQKSEGPV